MDCAPTAPGNAACARVAENAPGPRRRRHPVPVPPRQPARRPRQMPPLVQQAPRLARHPGFAPRQTPPLARQPCRLPRQAPKLVRHPPSAPRQTLKLPRQRPPLARHFDAVKVPPSRVNRISNPPASDENPGEVLCSAGLGVAVIGEEYRATMRTMVCRDCNSSVHLGEGFGAGRTLQSEPSNLSAIVPCMPNNQPDNGREKRSLKRSFLEGRGLRCESNDCRTDGEKNKGKRDKE